MSIIWNGTEISDIQFNGVEPDAVHFNGVEVWIRFALLGQAQSSVVTAFGPQVASMTFNTDGSGTSLPSAINKDWGEPVTSGIGADYEIYFSNLVWTDNSSGTASYTTPALNTWLSLDVARATTASTNTSAQSSSIVTMNYSIRQKTNTSNIVSSTISVSAETLNI